MYLYILESLGLLEFTFTTIYARMHHLCWLTTFVTDIQLKNTHTHTLVQVTFICVIWFQILTISFSCLSCLSLQSLPEKLLLFGQVLFNEAVLTHFLPNLNKHTGNPKWYTCCSAVKSSTQEQTVTRLFRL